MSRSPRYVVPTGKKDMSLAGIDPCGCITAAFAVEGRTVKDIRDFYASMGETGREIRWVVDDEIRARLFHPCADQHPTEAAA